jgi:hypothetical protein
MRIHYFLHSLTWRTVGAGLGSLLFCLAANAQGIATEAVFSKFKDRLVQIRIIDTSTNAQSTLGSGFFIDKSGTIITNYHVISKHVFKPKQYRIEYVMHDASVHPAQLVNIDVVHDLAVLDGQQSTTPYLNLMDHTINKGERIYTLGNPLDLGMTIVESTYNGLTDDTMHERIMLSGALNPGMSGGPSITEDGTVIGVNVAATGTNIGFLVTATFLKKLLQHKPKFDSGNFIDRVREQLLVNQADYMHALLAKPFKGKMLGDYVVPDKLAPYLNCWGDTDEENKPYRGSSTICAIKNDIFLNQHFSTGEIRYSHHYFSGEKMNNYRFYFVMQQYFTNPGISLTGNKEDVTEFNCMTDFVEQDKLRFKVAFCLREYKKIKGVYDMMLNAASVSEDNQGLVTTLTLGGISYDNAVAFGKEYLRAFKWNRR